MLGCIGYIKKTKKWSEPKHRDFAPSRLKTHDFEKKILFSTALCGHVALGTFSGTCLKNVVFDVNVDEMKKCPNFEKS